MFDGANNLELDIHNDVIFFPWNEVGDDLGNESELIEYNNGGIEIRVPRDGLGDVAGNIFVLSHGNYAPIAGGGGANGDRSIGAHKLARILANSGLPVGYANNVVVWTCFGGVPGGLAQTLMLGLKNRGYGNLKVWGCMEATGTFAHGQAFVHRGLKMGVVNDTDLLPFGTSVLQGNRVTGIAAKADMRCYG